jgi:hypothetical protein
MSEASSLTSKMEKVKKKLARLGLTYISEDVTKTEKSKFIYSFILSRKNIIAENYPMWLEVQFSKENVTGPSFHDHVDYELKRLKRGVLTPDDMRRRYPDYRKHHCVEDECYHDINIINRILGRPEIR